MNNNDTYTFIDASKMFQFTVKAEFLVQCPTPEIYDHYILNTRFRMPTFLHNPNGPAFVNLKGKNEGYREFWINGRNLSFFEPQVAAKLAVAIDFDDKMLRELE